MSTANVRPYATRSRAAAAAKLAPGATSAAVAPRRGAALGDITNAIGATANTNLNANIAVKGAAPGVGGAAALPGGGVKDKSDASARVRRTALTKPTSAAAQRRARAARQRKAAAAVAAAAAATAATEAKDADVDAIADAEDAKSELAMGVATKARIEDAVAASVLGGVAPLAFEREAIFPVFGGVLVPPMANDIDEGDSSNPLAVSQFAPYIFDHFRKVETKFMVEPNYMDRQEDITVKMRAILVDWLVDVHQKFKLCPETLYLTVNIIDRFLAVTPVKRRKLQLVGVTAMLIASKYEEIYAPETADFVYISDKAYDREEILHMEAVILGVLKFDVTVPSSLVFLNRCLKAARAPSLPSSHTPLSPHAKTSAPSAAPASVVDGEACLDTPLTARAARAARRAAADGDGDDHLDSISPTPTNATTTAGTLSTTSIAPASPISADAEHLAMYLLELSLQSATMLPFRASVLAATSCLLAGKLLSEDTWSPTLQHYSGDPRPADLAECEAAMRLLLQAEVKGATTNKLTAIRRKFSSPKYNEVANQAMHLDLTPPAHFSLRPIAAGTPSDYACMEICCEDDSE